ncbi:MAG: hypothetical protein ACI38Y_05610 [Candidatus Methanomethylophilaceae archaeon]
MADRKTYAVSALEEKHLIGMLMYLRENGPSRKTDIYDAVSTNPRMTIKVERLEAMGLINTEFNNALRSTVVTLTEEGRQVAEHLASVDSLLLSIQ